MSSIALSPAGAVRLGAVIAVCATAFLVACATVPAQQMAPLQAWEAVQTKDQFTDTTTCLVLPREGRIASGMGSLLYQGNAYPYVESRPDGLRVGLRSGGVPMPMGRVQIRIDQHDEWTIDTSETPVDSGAVDYRAMMAASGSANPASAAMLDAVGDSVNQQMSPYTSATGAKAAAILEQMKAGEHLIYRRLGANTAASTTGRAPLDASFRAALDRCGL